VAKDDRRFVIVPREVLTEERYAPLRADRAALGAWLLLYLEADALWPLAPSIPRWVDDEQLALMNGLLTVTGDRYRLAIVDASREAAKDKASRAADARWGNLNDARSNAGSDAPSIPPGNAPSDAQPMLDPMPTKTQTQTESSTVPIGRSAPPGGAREGRGAKSSMSKVGDPR